MFKKEFLKAVAERAIKTFVQVIVVAAGGLYLNLITLDWATNLKLALGAALLSVLTSFGSSKIGNNGPSLVGEIVDIAIPIVQKSFVTAGLASTATITATRPEAVVKPVVKKRAVSKK